MSARLSMEEMAELSALADGTLPAERSAEVEARVAASPELMELLERQRQAVLATQALAAEEVPEPLRAAVEARRRPLGRRSRARGRVPRFALAGAAAVAAVVVAAVVLSGGPGAPTVADAARLGTQSPTAAPPPVGTPATKLAIAVEGVAFPNLAPWSGWRAVGVRRGRLGGRSATIVYYAKAGGRIAYVIVAGPGLSRPSGAQATFIRRVEYQTLRLSDRLAVTWRRGGHTCVLIGQASRAELLKLASWPFSPPR
jgi:anti-sigma factor RsiW